MQEMKVFQISIQKLNGPTIDTTNEIKSISDTKNENGWKKNETVQSLILQMKLYQCSIQ